MGIDLDLHVGLRSKFYTSFLKLFSLGLLWNRNSVKRTSGRPDLSNTS
jgi:hypothetical protein